MKKFFAFILGTLGLVLPVTTLATTSTPVTPLETPDWGAMLNDAGGLFTTLWTWLGGWIGAIISIAVVGAVIAIVVYMLGNILHHRG